MARSSETSAIRPTRPAVGDDRHARRPRPSSVPRSTVTVSWKFDGRGGDHPGRRRAGGRRRSRAAAGPGAAWRSRSASAPRTASPRAAVQLPAQPGVLVLELAGSRVIPPKKSPTGREHPAGRRLHRGEGVAGAVARTDSEHALAAAAEVEGDDRDRREDEQHQEEAVAPRTPVDGQPCYPWRYRSPDVESTCRRTLNSSRHWPAPRATEWSGFLAMTIGMPVSAWQPDVEAVQQRAAAGEDDALLHDVGGQLGRGLVEGDLDRVDDGRAPAPRWPRGSPRWR